MTTPDHASSPVLCKTCDGDGFWLDWDAEHGESGVTLCPDCSTQENSETPT